jgi:hypothetical protein
MKMMIGKRMGLLSIASALSGFLILALAVDKYGNAALLAGAAALGGAFALLAIATIQTCLWEITRKLEVIAQKLESLESEIS